MNLEIRWINRNRAREAIKYFDDGRIELDEDLVEFSGKVKNAWITLKSFSAIPENIVSSVNLNWRFNDLNPNSIIVSIGMTFIKPQQPSGEYFGLVEYNVLADIEKEDI